MNVRELAATFVYIAIYCMMHNNIIAMPLFKHLYPASRLSCRYHGF
jgi:hypothetical protein